ncbi:FHA domain-containing protein [Citricoccus sp. GCM10030269]|uniref:FHA domain-containing protein n=1 Tax=Citricoccus sp. GCM10030269 TaxID=3273388 RepID=UPI003613BAB9
MSATARVRYSAGPWLGLVRGRCLVALPADASEETASVAWDLLAGTPGVEKVLATVLSGRLDLTGLPSFAIVSFREGGTVHAILRGEVSLRMTGAERQETELNGTGVATWNERIVQDVTSFELLAEGALSDSENLPLEAGVVRLSSLNADLADTDSAAEADDAVAATEAVAAGEAAPEAQPDAEAEAAPAHTDADDEQPAAEPVSDPTTMVQPVGDGDDNGDGNGDDDGGEEADTEGDVAEDAVDESSVKVAGDEPETGDTEEPAADRPEERDEADQDSADEDSPDHDDVEQDIDATIAPGDTNLGAEPSEPTPSDQHEETTDDADDRTIASAPSVPPAPAPSPVPEQGQAPEPSSPRAAGPVPRPQELIDSVPWLAAARKTVPQQSAEPAPSDLNVTVSPDEHQDAEQADDADTVLSPGVHAAGAAPPTGPSAIHPAAPTSGPQGLETDADHDGQTVMKSDLDLAGQEAAPAQVPPPPPATGPVVLARLCSDGHANPPTNSKCGVCGQSLSGEAQQTRRPSLGRIRMSTGEVLELDRPAVIGRQPQAHRVGSGTMPRMIQVRSPNGDVSRSHVEVVLEGWHVQLRDLKATNGTVLIREGQAPRRLGQSESVMVLDGDIADLGDGVSLRFEGLL